MRIVVVSCPRRKPIQDIWKICQAKNWRDCPFPIDILSPEQDIGWNANLLKYLNGVVDDFILLLLDDHFIDPEGSLDYTANMLAVQQLMIERPDIGMVKVQAGNAASPEIPFENWKRLREYDRVSHRYKRTNLVPTVFRRDWLKRLTAAILEQIGPDRDKGRDGALMFESIGTKLTEDRVQWPERMLGIDRPNNGSGHSLLTCIANDGVREGRLQVTEAQLGFNLDYDALWQFR